MKKITLVALAFIAFSCSGDNEEISLKPVTIVEIAKATPELSTFVEALEITDLTETFNSSGNYTVFVPDNAAFSSLLSALGADELSDVDPVLLANVLKYHVVDSRVLSSSLTDGMAVTTLFGQQFTVNIDTDLEEVSITDGNSLTSNSVIGARDVRCTNGIIHRIDSVLLPSLD